MRGNSGMLAAARALKSSVVNFEKDIKQYSPPPPKFCARARENGPESGPFSWGTPRMIDSFGV
jgi:hypothetical protein